MDYYKKAMDFFNTSIKNPIFYFFSDDIDWCIENFGIKNNFVFVSNKLIKYNNSTVEDLFLMSCCKHNIIANSTFSWWGAWLNKNPKKIVIRPPHYYNGSNINIWPDTWIDIFAI